MDPEKKAQIDKYLVGYGELLQEMKDLDCNYDKKVNGAITADEECDLLLREVNETIQYYTYLARKYGVIKLPDPKRSREE